jgi:hypothetical protein
LPKSLPFLRFYSEDFSVVSCFNIFFKYGAMVYELIELEYIVTITIIAGDNRLPPFLVESNMHKSASQININI